MAIGKTMLGRRHVLPSVVSSLDEMMVEGTFPSGTYLVTVHHPISTDDGDLEKALYGSFLPVPSNDIFPLPEASVYESKNQPGAVVAVKGEAGRIKLNEGRRRIRLTVKSMGDRPIQVRILVACTAIALTASLGWVPLPLHRGKPTAPIRSRTSPWISPRHPSRYFRTLRTRRHENSHTGTNRWKPGHQGRKRARFRLHRRRFNRIGHCGEVEGRRVLASTGTVR